MVAVDSDSVAPWPSEMPKLHSKRSSMASVQMIIQSERRKSSIGSISGSYVGSRSRGGSIASLSTLSKISFSSQATRLALVRLPQAHILEKSATTTTSAVEAFKYLQDAASDIQRWLKNSSQVLRGLDAEDDIGWAAAAGREGVAVVDNAMKSFEDLIQIYIAAVEQLQARQDVALVAKTAISRLLDQIEDIASIWEEQKKQLQAVKLQVELSLEWEELQSGVLNEIDTEMEQLSKLVYEMEEQRHRIDYGFNNSTTDLTREPHTSQEQLSSSPVSPLPSDNGPTPNTSANSSLMSLVARMQPLRASLDFLPMRLSSFLQRATAVFPTACKELEQRQISLEQRWDQLEMDTRALKKELGEDRWIVVFRNAAQQAIRMMDSVQRSISQVEDALRARASPAPRAMIARKIESYKAKTKNYCPAVERVLDILAKGVRERASINGEVIRLQSDARQRWALVGIAIRNLDVQVAKYEAMRSLEVEESLLGIDHHSHDQNSDRLTPASSPISSVYLLSPVPGRTRQELYPPSPTARPSMRSRLSSLNVRGAFSRSSSKEPLTPDYTPRASFLPVRSKDERSALSASLNREAERPSTPSYSGVTSGKASHPAETSTPTSRTAKPRWNSSTRIEHSRNRDTSTFTASTRSPLRQRDSAVGLAASYAGSSAYTTTPLTSKRSRYLNTDDQSLVTPHDIASSNLRPGTRARTHNVYNHDARFALAAQESPFSKTLSFSSKIRTSQIDPSVTKTAQLDVPRSLRARASLAGGHLTSAYKAERPLTPRAGTSFGMRRDQHGLSTPQSLQNKPRWRP